MKWFYFLAALIVLLVSAGGGSSCQSNPASGMGDRTSSIILTAPYNNSTLVPYNINRLYAAARPEVLFKPVLNTSTLYYGDANEDGSIDMGDVVWVERIILGLQSNTAGADANHDGSVNMGDVVTIDLIVLGIVNAMPIDTQTPVQKTITLTDADLPAPPISGMTFHFIAPEQNDPGPGKIRVSYGFFTYSIWFGVDNHKLWLYHVPRRDSIPASLTGYYDSLGIDQYTTYTEEDGKYWFDEIPPWINIAKYDPGLSTMPVLESASSTSGQAQITYTRGS